MEKTNLSLMITRVRDQARITRSFDLRVHDSGAPQKVDFVPGQVAILRVPGQDPAYFAFAGAPEDPELEVLVKQKVGASNVIYDMRAGETIDLVGIVGHGFPLDAQKQRDLVFCSDGDRCGAAAFRTAARFETQKRVWTTGCVVWRAHARRLLLSRRN